MVSANVWNLLTDAKYWLPAVQRVVISLQYQTSAVLNNLHLLNSCAIRYTFKAYERLKREQHIDTLFRTGKAFSVSNIKFIYRSLARTEGELSPVRVAFSVPKKKFRLAPQRNRIKRLLREAWRLNKNSLYQAIPPEVQLHVFLIFTDVKMPAYESISEAVIKGIGRLSKEATS